MKKIMAGALNLGLASVLQIRMSVSHNDEGDENKGKNAVVLAQEKEKMRSPKTQNSFFSLLFMLVTQRKLNLAYMLIINQLKLKNFSPESGQDHCFF